VGSSGQKPRKKRKQQPHTATQQHEAHLHAEQEAVLGNMGLGSSPQWVKVVAIVIIVVLVMSALGSFIVLTTR
jgi:hypothetical protein